MRTVPIRSQYKAVVVSCRCCCNLRRYIVSEDEAGYVEAQWVDGNDKLLFTARDVETKDAPDEGKFSISLNCSDLSGLQIFPLAHAEVAFLQAQQERLKTTVKAAAPVGATNARIKAGNVPEKPKVLPKTGVSALLGGAK